MGSKKKCNPESLQRDGFFLSEVEYWRWMCSIQEMGRRKAEYETVQMESKLQTAEIQNKQIALQLHAKTRLERARQSVENSTREYENIKSEIEARVGVSLNSKMIDEFTFEIKDLPTT